MDRFNNLYRNFLSYLLKNFPSYEKYINIEENPDKRYLYDFVELNLPYMEDIVENIMLSGNVIIEESSSDYSESESEEEEDEEEEQLKKDFEKMLRGGKTENGPNNDDKDKDAQEHNQGQPSMEKMFEGSLIGNLAKELSEEIDPKDLGDIKNPSDIFSALFNQEQSSGSGLGNIMNTVVKKLDSKMKSGELNQEQLFSEAQNMIGNSNLFGPLQQMGAMAGMNMMGNQGKKNKKNKKKNNRKRR